MFARKFTRKAEIEEQFNFLPNFLANFLERSGREARGWPQPPRRGNTSTSTSTNTTTSCGGRAEPATDVKVVSRPAHTVRGCFSPGAG
jgi:hypothetical protein